MKGDQEKREKGEGLLCEEGAFNLSLKDASIEAGNVYPRSQISTSFLIFSYKTRANT